MKTDTINDPVECKAPSKQKSVRKRAERTAHTTTPESIEEVLNRRLYPYQRKWIEDESRFKLGLWARQTGKDFTCAAEAVADCLRFPGSQWLIIACTERQAFQSLEKVKEWAEEFGCAVEGNLSQVRFSNGSRITTLPAKPASIRGYSANLILTEFAFHDDCEAVWRAAFPVVTRPGKDGRAKKVRIISTPHGRSNLFYRLWSGQTFSKHFIDIHDAVAQGLPLNAAELEAGLADPEAWAQEYLCQFIDDSSVLLPDDLLTGCQSPEASEHACPQKLSACTGPLFMGVACGLQRTVCWILEQVQLTEEDLLTLNLNPNLALNLLDPAGSSCGAEEERLRLRLRLGLRGERDTLLLTQAEALRPRAALARRVYLDYRGPGVGIGQYLARHLNIPRHPVALACYTQNIGGPQGMKLQMEPVTTNLHSELVGELQAALQGGRVRLPVSDPIREELHSLQAVRSDTGQITYRAGRSPTANTGADTATGSRGNGERITALALALRAALESGVNMA
jgi:hypothetical protein